MKKVFFILSLLLCSISIGQATQCLIEGDAPHLEQFTTENGSVEICDYDIVTATVYNAVPQQCNADVEHTAFMFKLDLKNPYKHKIIALSRDLLKKYPKGSKVMIVGTNYDGIFTVMDKMNKRYTSRIDILINQEMAIGKWDNVRIYKLGLAT